MNDAMLKALTKARLELTTWTRSRDRGQTAVEYLGIIVVVVAIVVAITGTDIGNSIKNAITQKIADLTGK
ncbi:Flp family type IVb pilin [Streptomyces sp. NPDC051822]|uniref:Flp family type IVb pilin n=2 Tax=unclassified Streptomyces TaxID=2593676 RepID=UPI0037A18076